MIIIRHIPRQVQFLNMKILLHYIIGTMSRPGTRYALRSKMCCIAMSPLDLIHARHDSKTMSARRAAKHIQTGKMKYIHSLFTPLSTSMHHCHLIVPFILAALCQGPHGREENYRLPDNQQSSQQNLDPHRTSCSGFLLATN